MINEKSMTLATDYSGQDVTGWIASEKLDGCRAYWDGAALWTRGGNAIEAPAWFTAAFPQCHLDGEIWAGRGNFEKARRAVQYGQFGTEVSCPVKFMAFDVPEAKGNWLQRMYSERDRLWSEHAEKVGSIGAIRIQQNVSEWCKAIVSGGGEGLILRNPAVTTYEKGRTPNLIRVKPEFLR